MALSKLPHIDPQEYLVRDPACAGYIRFYKAARKERSSLFHRLNAWINLLFDAWLERLITPDELAQAKAHARQASDGQIPLGSPRTQPPIGGSPNFGGIGADW